MREYTHIHSVHDKGPPIPSLTLYEAMYPFPTTRFTEENSMRQTGIKSASLKDSNASASQKKKQQKKQTLHATEDTHVQTRWNGCNIRRDEE